MDVEIEDAIQAVTGGAPVGDDSAWKWIAGILGSIVLGFGGWLIKRQRSGQILEDTENETKTDMLQRANKRVRELEEQLGEVMSRSRQDYDDTAAAQRAANAARIEADNASAAASRAEDAAQRAQQMVTKVNEISAKQMSYILDLRALLERHNIPVPPMPEGI